MPWLSVDKNYRGEKNVEFIHSHEPYRVLDRVGEYWENEYGSSIRLTKGTIEKLLGYEMTWEDEPQFI